jgi:hypothetical protein
MTSPKFLVDLDQKGSGALPAFDRLAGIDESYLHHAKYDLRHPKGGYSVSLGRIYSRVEACAKNLEIIFNRATTLDDLNKLSEFLERAAEQIEACLYAAAEHVDDVESVTLCFYPDKKAHERAAPVKSFKRDLDRLRRPFSSKANFIKHNQAQVRLFSTEFVHGGWPICLHGFFVEQHSGGVLGPSPTLHPKGHRVLSVVTFLWDVLIYSYEVSLALTKLIDAVAPKLEASPTPCDALCNAFVAVARLPNYVMDGVHPFERANVSVAGSDTAVAAMDSCLYGSIAHPWSDTTNARIGRWRLAYSGDGVSKSFSFLAPEKISVKNWGRPQQ